MRLGSSVTPVTVTVRSEAVLVEIIGIIVKAATYFRNFTVISNLPSMALKYQMSGLPGYLAA